MRSLLALSLYGPVACAETVAELDDAAARMQYAFYTTDVRALEEVLRLVEGFDVDAGLTATKSYQLAYGNWKLSQLYLDPVSAERPRPNGRSLAAKAAQSCVQHARQTTAAQGAMAEAYAIEAACAAFSAAAPFGTGGCARSKSLRTAQTLAPENPRVKLIEAMCLSGNSADPAAADRWRAVVERFEAAPPSEPGNPDWGHVEALTMLGDAYLRRGDPVAARDALERALVLAPDYKQAQQLLQTAATRPR